MQEGWYYQPLFVSIADRHTSSAEASITSADRFEQSEKGIIHLEIGVTPPEKGFTSSEKEVNALRKEDVCPQIDRSKRAMRDNLTQ